MDGEAVLQVLPVGEKSIKVIKGGMDVDYTEPDNIIISSAAILVTI